MKRTDFERLSGRQQHERMTKIIEKEFPRLSSKKRVYIRHRVCRYIKNFKNDNYHVVIGANPVSAGHYTNDDIIYVGSTKIYISILVD